MSKRFTINSYNSAGEFVGNITDSTFDSFRKVINGGLSDLTFQLARKIDDFNTNGDVSIGNKIEIVIYDEDTTESGVTVYSGYVEQQNIRVDGGQESVEIVCLGVVSKLNQDVLKSGAQTGLYTKATDGLTTVSADNSAAEIADVMKEIIELFNTNNSVFPIYYNLTGVSSIETTGNLMKYKFDALNYLDAIEKCREVSPQNWYWYIGADNVLNFKPKASTADHTFLLTKHIKSINGSKSADSVKNVLLLYAEVVAKYKEYKDDASISIYGRRVSQMNDYNIKDETTMDNIAAAFINENKDPKIRIELEIIDNNESTKGYDIESINPGDTCEIVGLTPDENIFTENMVIQEVTWRLGVATVIVETEKVFGFDRLLLNVEKKVNELDKTNFVLNALPDSYT